MSNFTYSVWGNMDTYSYYTIKSDGIMNNTLSYETPYNRDVCPICYNDIVKGEKIAIPSCDHEYHYACLQRWVNSIENKHKLVTSGCPTCRGNLEKKHKYYDIEKQVAARKEEIRLEKEEIRLEKEKLLSFKEGKKSLEELLTGKKPTSKRRYHKKYNNDYKTSRKHNQRY